ncbi:MAG: prolyl-tRNA synthetase associated domain-containing protein [Mesorhizobium sp.]|nr:prolyl-tRNA synthetase associated domain-containing protein [Mesorhizobium sp.]
MPKTPTDLLAFLDSLGIAVVTTEHPPLFTVAESQALRGEIPGRHTKNLFLKDKKDNFFLVTTGEDSEIDLKTVHQIIGAASRVSFGNAEKMLEFLGVTPGAVTPFGIINDSGGRVRVVLDDELMRHAIVNAHPLVNTATISVAPSDLVRFMKATGHEPAVLKLAG